MRHQFLSRDPEELGEACTGARTPAVTRQIVSMLTRRSMLHLCEFSSFPASGKGLLQPFYIISYKFHLEIFFMARLSCMQEATFRPRTEDCACNIPWSIACLRAAMYLTAWRAFGVRLIGLAIQVRGHGGLGKDSGVELQQGSECLACGVVAARSREVISMLDYCYEVP